MPTHQKQLKMQQYFQMELNSATWCQIEDQLILHLIWHIWITYATTWFVFAKQIHFPFSMSKTLVLVNQNLSRLVLIKTPKTPLFPIIKFLPHKRAFFWNKRILSLKAFEKFTQVVADPVALALNSPPLAISTKTEELFGPFNPIASPKLAS
jgi:hypothetical protein